MKYYMDNAIRIIFINLVVSVVLWIVVEVSLHFLGVNTLSEMGKKPLDMRLQEICRRCLIEKPVFYDAFYTDNEAIFKANPKFDFSVLFKENGNYIINSEGFRGNEFKPVETRQPSVLLVGDSFVWGYSATPIQNSFADLLQNAGFYVYNGGIPGTDPLQYLKIVKKYAPLLKPDVVAVFIYMGNDINLFPHPLEPYKNLHYVSNFGYFLGYDNRNGNYFSNEEESFAFLMKRYCGRPGTLWDYFISKTILGKLVFNSIYQTKHQKPDPERKWLRDALEEMKEICRSNGSEFVIFLIPTMRSLVNPKLSIENDLHFFKGFQYFYPTHLNKNDYQAPPDDHFNNQGHRKFADFTIRTLKEKG